MPSKFHRSIGRGHADTQADIDERVRHRTAGQQVNREMHARFDPITSDNVQAALDWQEARMRELLERP